MGEEVNRKHKPRELSVLHLSFQTRGEQNNRARQVLSSRVLSFSIAL